MGANNVDPNANYAQNRNAECTSVPFQDVDKSSYWAVRWSTLFALATVLT